MRVILVVLCLLGHALATEVRQCANTGKGKSIDDLNQRIQVGGCKKPPCRLRKDSFIDFAMKFKADHDIKALKTTVNANILGIPFPFPGVDGTSACNSIYKADGKTKVGCDLKGGEEYLYKTKIEVLRIYPRVKTVVHWALTEPNGEDVICFEVPARITN